MKRAGGLTLALFWLTLATTPARDTYPRVQTVDAIDYRIRLEVKETGEQISGDTEILFAVNEEGVKEITLDFADLTIDTVSEDDRPASYSQSGERLAVRLGSIHHRGERCRIRVSYHGAPKDGLFIKANKFGDRAVFADNWPNRAHHWFPSIDHPYDKATVEFFVTAPAGYEVVANGELIETTNSQNGARLTHWREPVPIPTYCMVVGATEFSVISAGALHGVPLTYYVYPKDRAGAARDFGRALQMLEFYANLIGPYPYEKLALVESSTRFGGMENASAIFFPEEAFNGKGTLEPVVAHEIAHQWFGDSVTERDWHHLWLSEGFATYFSHVFYERTDGRDRFIRFMLDDKQAYLQASSAGPRPIYDPAITNLFDLLNANNYQKAGWMLHMLRHVMGDEEFFAGIRDYYRTYRDRNALTDDFESVMERHAGRRLDWFFKEWFYGAGHPVYDATWHWNELAKELRLRLVQKQSVLFRMPVDVEIALDQTVRREVVDAGERDQTFTFKLDRKPDRVSLDPGEWILKVATLKEE